MQHNSKYAFILTQLIDFWGTDMGRKSDILVTSFQLDGTDDDNPIEFSQARSIGERKTETAHSKKLLAHELTHTIQQAQGKKGITFSFAKLTKEDATTHFRIKKWIGKTVKITAISESGKSVLTLRGTLTKAEKDSRTQEWSICYETIQRVY